MAQVGSEAIRDLKTGRVKWLVRAINTDMDRLTRVSRHRVHDGVYVLRAERLGRHLRSRIAHNKDYLDRMVCDEGACANPGLSQGI